MSVKIVEDVASRVAGEDVIPLVRTLRNRRDVSEFTLATETKTEINLVRNRLYRLYNANLVTSIKKKDKKKGWYIYYWTLNLPRFQYLAKDLISNRLSQLKERLAREKSSSFFMCQQNCIRLNFEQATDFEFKCPECGELLHQDDNTKKIKEIEKDIKMLEKDFKKKLPVMKPIKEKPVAKKKQSKILDDLRKSEVLNELTSLHKKGINHVDPADLTGAIKGSTNLYFHLGSAIRNAEKSVSILTTETGLTRKSSVLKNSLNKAKSNGVKIRFAAPLTKNNKDAQKTLSVIGQVKKADAVKARFCVIDGKSVVLMALDDSTTHPKYDFGVWVNTDFFAKSFENIFNMLWNKK